MDGTFEGTIYHNSYNPNHNPSPNPNPTHNERRITVMLPPPPSAKLRMNEKLINEVDRQFRVHSIDEDN